MMRSLAPILLLCVFGLTAYLVFSSAASADPADEARTFLKAVRAGDRRLALSQFGDNTCHCAPKGGYVAYLRYDLAADPNLAFLMGQKFELGQPTVTKLPFNGEKYAMPWDKPEDVVVTVPVTFPEQAGQPYFVPLDMAFGLPLDEAALNSFAQDPTRDWKRAFTLRLRPRLSPGLVVAEGPAPDKSEGQEAKLAQSLLPADLLKYQTPKDAAAVTQASGSTLPAEQIASQLPRLKSITVGLKVVRSGLLHQWTIKKLGVSDPVITSGGKEFKLAQTAEPASAP